MGFDDDEKEPKALIQYRDETSRWVTMENYQRFWNHVVGYAGWLSPVAMYREAARVFLEVKSVMVERLQDISEEDASAEGIKPYHYGVGGTSYKNAFLDVWNNINAKRGYSWDSNPWVWVIEFVRIDPKKVKGLAR